MDRWMRRGRKQGFKPLIGCHMMGERAKNETERKGSVCVQEREKVRVKETGSEIKKPFQTAW